MTITLDQLKDFLLSHYEKTQIDWSIYDYCYFNNLYLTTQEAYRILIEDPESFNVKEHILKFQKWNKTIESAAIYVKNANSQKKIFDVDQVILIRAEITGVDLSRIAQVLRKKEILTQAQYDYISKESIIVTLDTPKIIEITHHPVQELVDLIQN